jgi:hypothetical protein
LKGKRQASGARRDGQGQQAASQEWIYFHRFKFSYFC